jgi:3-methyl-2-oxobutanoate hydroxymethyltransferase
MVYSSDEKKPTQRKKVRVPDLLALKGKRLITSLTCYDATFARILEKTPLDFVLIGDSLGHVMQGQSSTLGVTVADVAYHTRCVAAALKTPLIVADMPFASAGLDSKSTFQNAEALIRAGAEAVKIEGCTEEICSQISMLTRHGIPVLGHIGLIPQSVHALGGYRVQGKNEEAKKRLLEEAQRLQDAGCFGIVLELVTSDVAAAVTSSIKIPTIGIGAGTGCDGQILVLQDMLGMNLEFRPKFLKHFAELENVISSAVSLYCSEVESRKFPESSS